MRSLEEKIERLAEPLLEERGLEVVDLEVARQGRRLWVRFFIDRRERERGGITVDECGEFNLALSRLLDVEELIPESYLLEVSSPGLNRRLRRLQDFRRCLGEEITVVTREALAGKKRFRGRLVSAEEEGLLVEVAAGRICIPLPTIARANLEYRFEPTARPGR